MKFKELKFKGVYLISNIKINDNRGYFSRIYCESEFKKKKLNTKWVQFNKSFNKKRYTFRGLHFQKKPYEEIKIIKCIKGEIIDLILDIRKNSKTYLKLLKINLSSKNNLMLYLPKGIAHGFITTKTNTEVSYMHSTKYNKDYSDGFNIFDKKIKFKMKDKIKVISKKDKKLKYINAL
jgi:dTDP-4-dehydrorhamnose 3,5-epimerase